MKIISKYKDFYDSFGYVLGDPDESIVYVRKKEHLDNNNTNVKSLIKKLERYYIYDNGSYGKKYDYSALVTSVIVGIYPYIYICPFYVIDESYKRTDSIVTGIQPIPILEKDVLEHNVDKIYNNVNDIFTKWCKEQKTKYVLRLAKIENNTYPTYLYDFNTYDYTQKSWQIENRDIFRELNAPIFYFVDKRCKLKTFFGTVETGIYINPVFSKEPVDIIAPVKNTIINNQNIYIDIENFLAEMKMAPEATPDNKTKILNAGFDLKTSFRNIK